MTERRETAVGVLIVEHRILLVQRAPTKASGPLLWECFGGKAEPGETLAAAIVREGREELGLCLDPIPSFVCETLHEPPEVTTSTRVTFMRVRAGIFSVAVPRVHDRIEELALTIRREEIAGFGWFTPTEATALVLSGAAMGGLRVAMPKLLRLREWGTQTGSAK